MDIRAILSLVQRNQLREVHFGGHQRLQEERTGRGPKSAQYGRTTG